MHHTKHANFPIEKYECDLYPLLEFLDVAMLFGLMIKVLQTIMQAFFLTTLHKS